MSLRLQLDSCVCLNAVHVTYERSVQYQKGGQKAKKYSQRKASVSMPCVCFEFTARRALVMCLVHNLQQASGLRKQSVQIHELMMLAHMHTQPTHLFSADLLLQHNTDNDEEQSHGVGADEDAPAV